MNVLRRNIASLGLLQFARFVLPLLTVPYLVRVLGPANYGRLGFAQAFIQYFIILTDYGFNLSATRAVAQIKEDREALSRLVSAVILVKAMLMLIGLAAMVVVVATVPRFEHDWLLYGLAYLSVLGNVLFPVWLFQGLERMQHITVFGTLARLVATIGIFMLVRRASDFPLAAGIQASGSLLAGMMALVFLTRISPLRLHWPGFAELRRVTADGWHIFISTTGVNLYTTSTVVILGLLTSPTAVGYYTGAQKIINAVQGLLTPVSEAVYPHIAALTVRSREAALEFIAKLLKFQGAATGAVSLLLFALATPVVTILLGQQFIPSIGVVRWLAFLPFIVGVSNVFGVQTMLNFDMKREFSRILLRSGLVSLVSVVPLAHWFGANGAAASVLATEVVVTFQMGRILWRNGLLGPMVRPTLAVRCESP